MEKIELFHNKILDVKFLRGHLGEIAKIGHTSDQLTKARICICVLKHGKNIFLMTDNKIS